MYTSDWGPFFWVFIHTVTYYSSNKQAQLKFFKLLSNFIPCNFCNKHYRKNIENIDTEWSNFTKQRDIIDWAISLHTKISKSIDENYVQPNITEINNLYKFTFQHEGIIFLVLDIIIKYGMFIKKEKELIEFIKLYYTLFPVKEKRPIISSIAIKKKDKNEFYINQNWTNIKYFKELFPIDFYKLDFILKFLPVQEEKLENIEVKEGQEMDNYTTDNFEKSVINYKYIVPKSKKVVLKLKGNCNKEVNIQIKIGDLKSIFSICELDDLLEFKKTYTIYPKLNSDIFEVKLEFSNRGEEKSKDLVLNIEEFHLELL